MNLTSTKCSFVALIGAPNAGKSTLLNSLVGSKVAIVTPKVQTTRNLINGICIYGNSQLIFIDTPGIFTPKQKIEQEMVKAAWTGVGDADLTALIIDSKKGICQNTKNIIERLSLQNRKIDIILNKIDLVKKSVLLQLVDQLQKYNVFNQIFMISAIKSDGVEDLKKYFAEKSNTGPWLYPEDDITTAPKRFLATEIVREQLFLRLDQELPYNVAVETEKWEEFDNGSVKINQVIYTTRDSHKKMIIGKSGELLKSIGRVARQELEQILGQKVHLFLFVKVRENWPDQFKVNY
jgi:GTP-binding protein Era